MGIVYLDNLPTKAGVGRNFGKRVIDWDKSSGEKVKFEYDDLSGYIEILKYKKEGQYLTIKYNDNECDIKTNNFQRGSVGNVLNKYSKDFKIKVGTELKDGKRNMLIIDREYRDRKLRADKKGREYTKNEKWYKYICNKCGWKEGWVEEGALILQKSGCSCCRGFTSVLGINTIWDTDRWMCDLGLSEEDSKRFTSKTRQKVIVKCPDCSKEKSKSIVDMYVNKSIGCTCGKGISYPEKFVIELFNQLNIEFKPQLTKKDFKWCKSYKYDFYFMKDGKEFIIETHGQQHYEDCKWSKVKDVQANDRDKYELAINNGFESARYIVVDCRISDMEYIVENIKKSELAKLFNLCNIDWVRCEIFALNNTVKRVCEYWRDKKGDESPKEIAKIFKLSDCTIRNYLNKGAKIWDWCNYDGRAEMIKSGKNIGSSQGKTVSIFKDNTYLGTFSSCKELSEQSEKIFNVKLNLVNISQVCLGTRKTHKGFTFEYILENSQLAI